MPPLPIGFDEQRLIPFYDLRSARQLSLEAEESIRELQWVKDGIEEKSEVRAVEGLISLSLNAEDTFSTVVEQSWVLDGTHKRALITLGGLAEYSGTRLRFLEHPAIVDGISEEEAVRLAVVTRVAGLDEEAADQRYDGRFAAMLFDEERITVEAIVVNLPLAGNVRVYIVQQAPEYTPLAQMIEGAMRFYEDLIAAPFPNEVMYFSAIERNPELDLGHGGLGGPDQVSTGPLRRTSTQASIDFADVLGFVGHEMGHFYFHSGIGWITEGGASFLAEILQNESYGVVDPQEGNVSCTEFKNIAEWELNQQGVCHYTLGAELFRDLYENLPEVSFRLGFRNLYLHLISSWIRPEEALAGCETGPVGVCHVRSAFSEGLPVPDARKASELIDHWYSGEDPLGVGRLRRVSGVVLDHAGKPVEGIQIEVVDAHSWWAGTWNLPDWAAITTDDGTFRTDLKPEASGEFLLVVAPGLKWKCQSTWWLGSDGLLSPYSSEPTPFELGENDVTGIVVRLPAEPEQLCNWITGTVVGPDGSPPDYDGVIVRVEVAGWGGVGIMTGSDGVFANYTPAALRDQPHLLSVQVGWAGKTCDAGYHSSDGLTPDSTKATRFDVSAGTVSDVVIRLQDDLCGR